VHPASSPTKDAFLGYTPAKTRNFVAGHAERKFKFGAGVNDIGLERIEAAMIAEPEIDDTPWQRGIARLMCVSTDSKKVSSGRAHAGNRKAL
jgi:hypothetical protein